MSEARAVVTRVRMGEPRDDRATERAFVLERRGGRRDHARGRAIAPSEDEGEDARGLVLTVRVAACLSERARLDVLRPADDPGELESNDLSDSGHVDAGAARSASRRARGGRQVWFFACPLLRLAVRTVARASVRHTGWTLPADDKHVGGASRPHRASLPSEAWVQGRGARAEERGEDLRV